MDRPQLLQHFDTLAETPAAVEKLRAFVLDLAVRGRLVPHATKPESDPAWLKICAELDNPTEGDGVMPSPPFAAPEHWRWALLEEVAQPCGQKKPDARFTYVDVGAIDNLRGVITPEVQSLEAHEAPSRARKLVRSGSVIYSTVRPYLRNIAVVDREFDPPAIVSTAFAVLHPKPFLDARFLFHWLRSGPFQNDVASKMKGVAYPAISDSELWRCQIPVPPPAEQRRIVAKVEELLALCDELEARQTAAREHRTRLVRSALDHLTTAKDEVDFQGYSVFVLQHSSIILEEVPAFRQAILQLAVQSRIVAQNTDEDPAFRFIERMAHAKAKLVREKLVSPGPALAPVNLGEAPFTIPPSWAWSRLGVLVESMTNGIYKHETAYADDGVGCLRMYNIKNGSLNLDNLKRMRLDESELEQYRLLPGDLLVNRVNSRELVGKAAVIPTIEEPLVFESKNIRVRLMDRDVLPHYTNILFQTREVRNSFEGDAKQTCGQASVNQPQVANLMIPLPPLAEQKRIVAKVDELMRWCDALEARLTAAQTTATHLLDATLNQILTHAQRT